jgi:hypothetical protein
MPPQSGRLPGNGQVQPVLDFASVCVQNDTPILVSSSNGG